MKYRTTTALKDGRECVIRSAAGDDAQAVLEVFLLTHEQTDFLSSYREDTDFDAEFERQFLSDIEKDPHEAYLCAVVDGQIVGTASVLRMGANKLSHRAEFGIAVDRDYWGVGIGRALTAACVDCASDAGYAQLELEVVADNHAAIALYEKMGFVEFGRNPRGFRSRYDGWQELVSMRMELE